MPTTITAYTTFVADTKARASEVNSNFSNHRGDLLPVNTDTATASHRTHDLGASDHYWDKLFTQNINFGLTSTSVSIFQALTTGSLDLSMPSSTQVEIRIGGATSAAFVANGINSKFARTLALTTSAVSPNMAASATVTSTGLNGVTAVTLTGVAITTYGGIIEVGFLEGTFNINATTTATNPFYSYTFKVDGTNIGSGSFSFGKVTSAASLVHALPMCVFSAKGAAAAGAHNITCEVTGADAAQTATCQNYVIYALER